jgi:hypothetical protein
LKRYLGGTSRATGEAKEGDFGFCFTCTESTLDKVRIMAQTILDQLLNSCMRNIECGLIYDYDPLRRYADLFAGFRGIL